MLLTQTVIFSQGNPFLGSPGDSDRTEKEDPPGEVKQSAWLQKSASIQKDLQKQIAAALKGENGLSGMLIFLGLSFLYGLLHALGPGHRKTVLFSYFIGENARPITGIMTGLLLAVLHAGSAVLLVGGTAWFTTRSLLLSVNQAEAWLYPVTYGIILILGLWMIIHGIIDFRHHSHSHGSSSKGLTGMLLSGLVPCPGASAIIIFSLASGTVLPGILAVLAMSLGMGTLLAGIGLAAVLFREKIGRLVKTRRDGSQGTALLELSLHTAGGLFLAAFGAVFLLPGLI